MPSPFTPHGGTAGRPPPLSRRPPCAVVGCTRGNSPTGLPARNLKRLPHSRQSSAGNPSTSSRHRPSPCWPMARPRLPCGVSWKRSGAAPCVADAGLLKRPEGCLEASATGFRVWVCVFALMDLSCLPSVWPAVAQQQHLRTSRHGVGRHTTRRKTMVAVTMTSKRINRARHAAKTERKRRERDARYERQRAAQAIRYVKSSRHTDAGQA